MHLYSSHSHEREIPALLRQAAVCLGCWAAGNGCCAPLNGPGLSHTRQSHKEKVLDDLCGLL